MSLTTRMHLLDKYGMRLSMEELAQELGTTVQVIRNRQTEGDFPIPTYLDGSRRFAAYEAVAQYFDDMYERSLREFKREKKPGTDPGSEGAATS